MSKALIDTSVFADALLKKSDQGKAAIAAIRRYTETQLPVYAIKEFKAGALRYYVWFHNKVSTVPWEEAVAAITRVHRQANRMTTALNALSDFDSSISKRLPADFAKRYPGLTLGQVRQSEAQIWLRTLIFQAWKKRRKLATRVVEPLSCYPEAELKLTSTGIIDDRPVKCGVDDCCLRIAFIGSPEKVERLLNACDALPEKQETTRRRQALRHLHRTGHRPLNEAQCRALGDAVFAFQCPQDGVVLTTNLADHEPLAAALGLSAVSP